MELDATVGAGGEDGRGDGFGPWCWGGVADWRRKRETSAAVGNGRPHSGGLASVVDGEWAGSGAGRGGGGGPLVLAVGEEGRTGG